MFAIISIIITTSLFYPICCVQYDAQPPLLKDSAVEAGASSD